MKKILALIVFAFLFCGFSYAQKTVQVYTDTVSNSEQEDIYIQLPTYTDKKLDSCIVSAIYTGEIDMDRLIVTKGILNDGTANLKTRYIAVTAADTTTLTVNNAAATVTGQVFGAVGTTLNVLGGYDAALLRFEAASSGNDATDPDELLVKITLYYSDL